MPEQIGILAKPRDPLDDAQSGQPLWYWALSREGKRRVLEERARKAGCTYGEDLSTVGCLTDGSPPPKAKRERKKGGIKMTARRRAAIEVRTRELLQKGRRT
jgi:hypothetical protein